MKRRKKRPASKIAELSPSFAANIGAASHRPAWWRRDWLLGFLLVLLTAFAYQPVWHAGTIWDDDTHLTPPALRSLQGLGRIWIQPGATQQYYPLVHSVFWVEHKLWGEATPAYHWLNIILHSVSVLLLVKILRRLKIPGAWLAAALFALHPIEVESVAWISELKNTLSGVFYLSAALAYLKFDMNRKWGTYALALGLFAMGLFSKTVIASLPGALLVIFWWQRGRLSLKRDVVPLIPFFAAGVAAGMVTAWVERKFIGAEGADFNFSIIERVLIAGRAVWFYLAKLFWPADLVFMYPRWNVSQSAWLQYMYPAALALLFALLVWRRWRGALAALLFFVGTLFPALGFVNVYPFRYSFVADHFQYLAGIGPLTLAAAGLATLPVLFRKIRPFFEPTVCVILLLTLATLTWRQSRMYANAETLWQTTLERDPACWMAHNNLGHIFVQKGQLEDAVAEFRRALDIKPDYIEAYKNLGFAFYSEGRTDDAVAEDQKALEIDPNYAEARNNLALALFKQGKLDEAIAQFRRALEIKPDNATVMLNLGNTLMQKGGTAEAIALFQKALAIEPNQPAAENNLAWLLATCPQASLRDGKKAVELAEKANALSGGQNTMILHTLAAALAADGRFPEAAATAQHALQIADAQSNQRLAAQLRDEINLYQAGSPLRAPTSP